jgi:Domain of unknown function (DUF4410)
MTIYVRDFELDAQDVNVDKGGVVGQVRPGIIERSKHDQQDPQVQAKEIVDTMSKSLINDWHKAGYKVERLGPNDPAPATARCSLAFPLKWTRAIVCMARSSVSVRAARKWNST